MNIFLIIFMQMRYTVLTIVKNMIIFVVLDQKKTKSNQGEKNFGHISRKS